MKYTSNKQQLFETKLKEEGFDVYSASEAFEKMSIDTKPKGRNHPNWDGNRSDELPKKIFNKVHGEIYRGTSQ